MTTDNLTKSEVTTVTSVGQARQPPWDKSSLEILRHLYIEKEESIEWIAHQLGRSPDAVKMKASRMGLKRPSHGDASSTTKIMRKHKATPQDIASRIASLLGEAPMIEVKVRPFTDQELLAFAQKDNTGLAKFLNDLLSIELQDYQLEIARLLQGTRNLVAVTGRQVGKDFVIGCFALWESIVKPNSKIVVVSAAQRQSNLLNERILCFVAGNDQLYASILKSSNEVISFKNGSSVYFLPATGLIRGFTEVTRVFVNEARDVPDPVYDAITPMLSRRNGHLAVFSTPLGRVGHLWEMYNSPLYEKIHVRSEQNAYLDKDFLKGEHDRMSNASYRCEYEGEFVSSQQNYFDPVSIQKALQDYAPTLRRESGKVYAIGIDWGRKQDASVMTVLSRDQGGALKAEYIKSFEGVSFEDQLPEVRRLRDAFKPIAIVPEETGLGLGPCDALERSGVRILRFKTTNESKIRAYDNLRAKFDQRMITIPVGEFRLQRELVLLEYEALPSGAVRISHPANEHDDFADSLALAAWGLARARTKPPMHMIIRPAPQYASPYAMR